MTPKLCSECHRMRAIDGDLCDDCITRILDEGRREFMRAVESAADLAGTRHHDGDLYVAMRSHARATQGYEAAVLARRELPGFKPSHVPDTLRELVERG